MLRLTKWMGVLLPSNQSTHPPSFFLRKLPAPHLQRTCPRSLLLRAQCLLQWRHNSVFILSKCLNSGVHHHKTPSSGDLLLNR